MMRMIIMRIWKKKIINFMKINKISKTTVKKIQKNLKMIMMTVKKKFRSMKIKKNIRNKFRNTIKNKIKMMRILKLVKFLTIILTVKKIQKDF